MKERKTYDIRYGSGMYAICGSVQAYSPKQALYLFKKYNLIKKNLPPGMVSIVPRKEDAYACDLF